MISLYLSGDLQVRHEQMTLSFVQYDVVANYTNELHRTHSPRLLVAMARSSHYIRVATVYNLHAVLE